MNEQKEVPELSDEEKVFISRDEEEKKLRLKLFSGEPFRPYFDRFTNEEGSTQVITKLLVEKEMISYIYDLLLDIKADTMNLLTCKVIASIFLELEIAEEKPWGDEDMLIAISPKLARTVYYILVARETELRNLYFEVTEYIDSSLDMEVFESTPKLYSKFTPSNTEGYKIKLGVRSMEVNMGTMETINYIHTKILQILANINSMNPFAEISRENLYSSLEAKKKAKK